MFWGSDVQAPQVQKNTKETKNPSSRSHRLGLLSNIFLPWLWTWPMTLTFELLTHTYIYNHKNHRANYGKQEDLPYFVFITVVNCHHCIWYFVYFAYYPFIFSKLCFICLSHALLAWYVSAVRMYVCYMRINTSYLLSYLLKCLRKRSTRLVIIVIIGSAFIVIV